MDVRLSTILCLSLFLISCNKNKTATSVFNEKQSQNCIAERVPNQFIVKWTDGHVSLEKAVDADQFTKNFIEKNLDLIERVEFDKKIVIKETAGDLHSFAYQPAPVNWGVTRVGADTVWAEGVEGEGVIVGVVDTVVDITHPQLSNQLYYNDAEKNGAPGVDDDHNGYVDDIAGWDFFSNSPDLVAGANNHHATHVAGIIAAEHGAGTILGMAPKAKIVSANFMDVNDVNNGGTLSDGIKAIRYVASRGAKIINMSWGGSICSDTLKEVMMGLETQGVLFVTASGNESTDFDKTSPLYWSYPAAFAIPNQLVVAATSVSDYMADFSNKSFSLVHIGAPGVDIYSTVPGGYMYLDGTSMATPFVTGAAALLYGLRPNATPKQIKQAILNSVDVRDYKVLTQGRLNVQKAVEELKKIVP